MAKKPRQINKIPKNAGELFQVLLDLARFLRSPEGCPWDRKQTCRSFAGYVGEEFQELQDALEEGDNALIREEWGDTLFTLLASAAAAESEGRFKVEEALAETHAKMIRRHGHIFGTHRADTPEDVEVLWKHIKSTEKKRKKTE